VRAVQIPPCRHRKADEGEGQPLRQHPEAQPLEGIPTTQNTMPSGEVVENKPLMIESKIVIKWDDIRSCNLEALAEQVDAMADERLAIVMPHFFSVFQKTCDAAGTGADAHGMPFSFELYLAGWRRSNCSLTETASRSCLRWLCILQWRNSWRHCRRQRKNSRGPTLTS